MAGDNSENFEPKWLCVFLIDLSMDRDSLVKLDKELRDFQRLIMEDATSRDRFELCVATFGKGFKVLREPASVERFTMPALDSYDNEALSNAVNDIVDRIEARKHWYKETGQMFYKPLFVLLTSKEMDECYRSDVFARVREDVHKRKYSFLNVAKDGASFANLNSFSTRLTDSRNLFQIILHYVSHPWEEPWAELMDDHREDNVILDDGILTGWVESFEI